MVTNVGRAYHTNRISIGDYLKMENASIMKHEYYKGEVFAMSGAKFQPNLVTRNVYAFLLDKLKGTPCQPFGSDLRFHIEKNTLFTYPDISIICGKPVFLHDDDMNVLNPAAVIEVLSDSSRNYDRGDKFRLYRDIDSLRCYILIEPEIVFVEAFHTNEEGYWELIDYRHIDDHLAIQSLNLSIPLRAVYESTTVVATVTQEKSA
jgi:Uma2 family endonuclease